MFCMLLSSAGFVLVAAGFNLFINYHPQTYDTQARGLVTYVGLVYDLEVAYRVEAALACGHGARGAPSSEPGEKREVLSQGTQKAIKKTSKSRSDSIQFTEYVKK